MSAPWKSANRSQHAHPRTGDQKPAPGKTAGMCHHQEIYLILMLKRLACVDVEITTVVFHFRLIWEHLEPHCMNMKALRHSQGKNRMLSNSKNTVVLQAEWPERYDAVGDAVRALQQRLEETKHSSREKDGTVIKLKNRLRQLEDAVQNACKEVDEKEARLMKEHKMLQDVSRPSCHLWICCYALLLNC